MKFATRLKQTASSLSSTTLSVGAVITLGAAATNCRTLAQAISDGATAGDTTAIQVNDTNVPFVFDDGTNWMEAYCTITSTTQITISQIISGSNGTSAVTFAGALPTVFNAIPGKWLRQVVVSTDGVSATNLTSLTLSTLSGTTADAYLVPLIDPATGTGYTATVAVLKSLFASTPADTTAPVMSGSITTSSVTSSSFTMTYSAGTDNVGITRYDVSIDTGTASWINNSTNLSYNASGLVASTAYTLRVRAVDAAGNISNVITGSVTTSAGADTTAPTLSSPTGTTTGSTTANGSVTTNEANGTLYYMVSTNATETAATVKTGSTQAVSTTGVLNVSFTGLTASTSYYVHFLHRDAAGNDSAVANSASFTTSAAATMASQYILSSTNSAYASYAGATMTGTSPNMLASTAVRVNIRSALTTSATYPANTDFKLVWGKAASDPLLSVCPISFSDGGVPANGPNGNNTAGGSNTVGGPSHLGGWTDNSSGFFGTFTNSSTLYAIGTPGNYVLWVVYSDGSKKMFDNGGAAGTQGAPVIWVLS